MADTQFLRLNEKWALGYDSLQWIIQRRGRFNKTRDRWNWQAESFISSNRDILVLTLQEKSIVPDLGKMEEVLALPYTFKEWIGRRQGRGAAGQRQGELDGAPNRPPPSILARCQRDLRPVRCPLSKTLSAPS